MYIHVFGYAPSHSHDFLVRRARCTTWTAGAPAGRRGLLRTNCRSISGPGTLRLRSGRAGSPWEGFVSAFDVDGGNLCAHGPEIRGELAAMMDRMANPETQIGDGRVIQEANVVNRGGEVFPGKRFETRQALGEVFVVPMSNVSTGL